MCMLKIRVMPCMLYDGRAIIKTIQFGQRRTLGNPVQFARVYNARNVDELIFLDIMATPERREPAYDVIRHVSNACFMPLSVGGGIRNIDSIRKLLYIGADKVVIGAQVFEEPDFVKEAVRIFGSQCIIASIDVRKTSGNYRVYVENGRRDTQKTVTKYVHFAASLGVGELFITSIDHDGMMAGYDANLFKKVMKASSVPVIASGGAGKPEHFLDLLAQAPVNALSAASIFHYTQFTPNDVKSTLASAGHPVRI